MSEARLKAKAKFGTFCQPAQMCAVMCYLSVTSLKGKWSSGQRVKTVPGCFSLFVIHLKTHYISSLM